MLNQNIAKVILLRKKTK